ncbi:hypothetical protein [Streptomyces sclerotialus]|uniref:hypothetical protein n=1 Tax=Streptomyces sclerotialus TaxID=1957 RepID=UPI000B09BFB9
MTTEGAGSHLDTAQMDAAQMLALQRSAGNAAVTQLLNRRPETGALALQRAGENDAGSPTYRLHIQVRKTSRTHRAQYVAGGFGHAWVTLYTKSGDDTSYKTYGFFPTEEVNARNAFRTVRGAVRKNYDSPDDATSRLDVELTAAQVEKFKEYVTHNSNHPYSLASYNCTTFARGAFKAATGKEAPGIGLPLLENPNALQDAIKRINQKQGKPRKGESISDATQAPNSSDSESDFDSDLNWVGASALEGNQALEPAQAPAAAPAVPTPGRFEID